MENNYKVLEIIFHKRILTLYDQSWPALVILDVLLSI